MAASSALRRRAQALCKSDEIASLPVEMSRHVRCCTSSSAAPLPAYLDGAGPLEGAGDLDLDLGDLLNLESILRVLLDKRPPL
jgi:hypothetical protein